MCSPLPPALFWTLLCQCCAIVHVQTLEPTIFLYWPESNRSLKDNLPVVSCRPTVERQTSSSRSRHAAARAPESHVWRHTTGALIIRVGFWSPLYYEYNKEPQASIDNYLGLYTFFKLPNKQCCNFGPKDQCIAPSPCQESFVQSMGRPVTNSLSCSYIPVTSSGWFLRL